MKPRLFTLYPMQIIFASIYLGYMYEFSIESLFLGLIILAIGAAMVAYHQKLADHLASGVSSYDRFRFWGLIVCGVGIAIMLSLHTIPLNWLVNSLFVR